MNTIRAFFAIVPSKEIRVHLVNVLQSLKQEMPEDYIRWVPIDNIHITLHFIAQLQLQDVVLLSQKVAHALKHTPCFQLKLGPIEWFPTLRHPKILSLVVEPHDILCKLASTIAQSLNSLNYPIESRHFRGHMTIGRLRHNQHKKQKLLSQIQLENIPPITIDNIYLIESKLGQERTTYTTLTEFPLTKIEE
ncbi:RNA 2',3'-cyclic phosphodiesterase [Legionella gratiana]|nr:RNA 2',3'-cyclic phosphodiesterase [Legionella gratiana]